MKANTLIFKDSKILGLISILNKRYQVSHRLKSFNINLLQEFLSHLKTSGDPGGFNFNHGYEARGIWKIIAAPMQQQQCYQVTGKSLVFTELQAAVCHILAATNGDKPRCCN